jgi:uncharacterized protein
MKRTGVTPRVGLLLLLAIAVTVVGCAVTDTTRYYALTTARAPAAGERPAAAAPLTIGVGPVAIPGYLDRPQVVTRDAGDAMEIWPYHRWAEPLDIGIAEALADDLSARIPSDRVVTYPWRDTLARTIDYQVVMAVSRFEGTTGRGVTLDARWRVLSRDGKELAFKRTTFTEPVTSPGVKELVAAMNRAIRRMGEEVAQAIQSQPAKSAATKN